MEICNGDTRSLNNGDMLILTLGTGVREIYIDSKSFSVKVDKLYILTEEAYRDLARGWFINWLLRWTITEWRIEWRMLCRKFHLR